MPLTDIVANIQFEMIGRPDAKVPPGTLWLTGYERSTLGPTLAKQGAAIVADQHHGVEVMGFGAVFPALGGSQLNLGHGPYYLKA